MAAQRQPDSSLVLGRNPVRELLEREPERIEKVMLQRGVGGAEVSEIRRLGDEADVQIQYVPAGRLNQLARGLNHQGVIATASPLAYADLTEMLGAIAGSRDEVKVTKPRLLLLDEVQDPFNFGAILRSAAAFGVGGVIVPQRNMAPLNAAAVKASAGTAGRVPVARVGNLGDTMYQLKERGYWLAGADAHGGTNIWEMDWHRPLAIVLGGEGKGLRKRTLDECDFSIQIPMKGPAESLNVSVAAGILLSAASRE